MQQPTVGKAFASIISDGLNPFIVLPFFNLYIFSLLHLPVVSWQFFSALLWHTILPLITSSFLIKQNKITDFEIINSKKRNTFFILLCFYFLINALILRNIPDLGFINLLLFIDVLVLALITRIWKISSYIALDTMMILCVFYLKSQVLFLIVLIPILACARIYIGKHTPKQVILGVLVSIIIFFIALSTL